jgi:3',5'-cyclic AMP phosphodiesterase CpdA
VRDFRFIQLSDIHFSQVVDHQRIEHDDVRHELLRDANLLHRELGKFDAILVAGDVAFSGQQSEYDRAADWLADLAAAVD